MSTPESFRIESLGGRMAARRRRLVPTGVPASLDLLPAEWRDLLACWARREGRSKWETLLKDAGAAQLQTADSLRDWLLRHGWAEVIEERRHGDWWPLRLELRERPALRAALGIRDRNADAPRWEAARAGLAALDDEALQPALAALDDLPVHRALARCDLVSALHRWRGSPQSGTRRDFSLFARGETKAVTDAEWNWLESILDLAEFGIERHTPLLLLSAPVILHLPRGRLDIAACPDFGALTPAAVEQIIRAEGCIARWHLIENRTSFERAARQREPETGVIWLPGFPPGWWRAAVARVLDLMPAPARISCDPDPAGIAIALQAAELWRQRGLEWEPWKMAAADLAALRVRIPLTERDAQQLVAQMEKGGLPAHFAELAAWMLAHGEKGEQEGYL